MSGQLREQYRRLNEDIMSVKKSQEVAKGAIERASARRWLEQVEREGLARRGTSTDDEVESLVERAIQGSRRRTAGDE